MPQIDIVSFLNFAETVEITLVDEDIISGFDLALHRRKKVEERLLNGNFVEHALPGDELFLLPPQ